MLFSIAISLVVFAFIIAGHFIWYAHNHQCSDIIKVHTHSLAFSVIAFIAILVIFLILFEGKEIMKDAANSAGAVLATFALVELGMISFVNRIAKKFASEKIKVQW